MKDNRDCQHAEELLPAYLRRDLEADDVAWLHNHLTGCEACRLKLAAWEKLERVTRASAVQPIKRSGTDVDSTYTQPAASNWQREGVAVEHKGGGMKNIDRILTRDPLVQLVQVENFIGWVFDIDYDSAKVMTNDLWKANVLGVPHNAFLVAAAFSPEEYTATQQADREVILLRVIGNTKLPQDDDNIRVKIDHFQRQQGAYVKGDGRDYDDITRNQIQFGGLDCRVLGTFYMQQGQLYLGSDLESFSSAARLSVYRPRGKALEIVVNYVDPLRKLEAQREAAKLGFKRPIESFRIGTVRYTSTDRLHRRTEQEKVPVYIEPTDYLSRRTAVLGMTRTGKSNAIKHIVSTVKRVADEGKVPIGQIIYDLNGEYANANQQDQGSSIADVYPDDTVRYRLLPAAGFEMLQNNFYLQLEEGFSLIRRMLAEGGKLTSNYVRYFHDMSLEEPDTQERSEHARWERRVAAYQALLAKAAFVPPPNHRIRFAANEEVRAAIATKAKRQMPDPKSGLTPDQAVEWFQAARAANDEKPLPGSTADRPWVDETLQNLLDMLVQESKGMGGFISGFNLLTPARAYHSDRRSQEVGVEVYQHLVAGKIVILDLSVGSEEIRPKIGKQVAQYIYDQSVNQFIQGKTPPNTIMYIEEAHNLIGGKAELTDTWPLIAKQGAKYGIALVYATQEVSSVHPNILANTENWVISHLNNEREVKELAKFYDFGDFSRSLVQAQDVGFARVKTLSSPFTVPVQIEKFDPTAEKNKAKNATTEHSGRTEAGDMAREVSPSAQSNRLD